MTQEELYANLCNEQIICSRTEHQSKMNVLVEQEEMNLFVLLKPNITQYNGKWQVVYNKLVFGEGETLRLAIYDFNKQFDKKI